MEKDFHYYMTYAMAKQTEYDQADTIAYASQFVDDNRNDGFRLYGQDCDFPVKLKKPEGTYYYPLLTQSVSFIMDPFVQKYVYAPFHFLPGDNNVSINGKTNPYSTTPNSRNAQKVLEEALKTKNPYRIGIALHAFTDTWSHQNFTGFEEDWNTVHFWNPITSVGHAQVTHIPDIISDKWKDYRLDREIDNRERAMEALKMSYLALQNASGKGRGWEEVAGQYRAIVEIEEYDKRIKQVGYMLAEQGLGPIPDYLKTDWINRALNLNVLNDDRRRKVELTLKPEFASSHWYRFNQAAKSHLACVLDLIQAL